MRRISRLLILQEEPVFSNERLVEIVMDNLRLNGHLYRELIDPDARWAVVTVGPREFDNQMFVAMAALFQFRAIWGEQPDLEQIEFQTFQGRVGTGVVVSQWATESRKQARAVHARGGGEPRAGSGSAHGETITQWLRLSCPCGESFAADASMAGKDVRCPACGDVIKAPRYQIPVACSCGRRFAAADRLAGKEVRCPECGGTIHVPRPKTTVTCASCGQSFRTADGLAGKNVKCPNCGGVIKVRPDVPAAHPPNDQAGNWYRVENRAKHVRQIVLKLPGSPQLRPQVSNLVPPGRHSGFNNATWGALTLFMGDRENPIVFVKADREVQDFRNCAVRVAFGFYRMSSGGLFDVLVGIDCPVVERATGNPCVFENPHNLGSDSSRKIATGLLQSDYLDLCFVGAGPNGPCTGYFGLRAPLSKECRAALDKEWNQLLAYHQSVPASRRSFQAATAQFERENPLEEDPIF